MEDREPGDLRRLGDLLGDTYADLAGETGTDRKPGAAGGRRAALGGPARACGVGAPAGSRGAPTAEPERMLAFLWPEVVGAEVAANAQPVQLRRKRLVVSAASSAWAQTLQFMGPAIKASINERLGAQVVEEIVFRHAGWNAGRPSDPAINGTDGARTAPSTAPPPPLTAEQEAALAEVETLDLAPELRERIIRAMKAAFVRGEQGSVR